MTEDPYLISGSFVLRNLFDLDDAFELDKWERQYVTKRFREGAPTGKFDLNHLRAIHYH